MPKHSGGKPVNCVECNYIFHQGACLRTHMSIHTPQWLKIPHALDAIKHLALLKLWKYTAWFRERRYDCVQCVKSFHRSEHLKTHMLVHTRERSYICRECNKSFSHLQAVQKELLHLEICKYKGIKLRICDMCKKSFSYAGRLKSHILSHTGEKNIFLQNVSIRTLC